MSSFQKRKSTPLLTGAKLSVHNGQQLLSTGNPALDHILGGGLALGSILLIEEDAFARYSEYLAKSYLAEGGVHDHALFLAALDTDPLELIQRLPAIIHDTATSSTTPSQTNTTKPSEEMRIAWRYNDLAKVDSEQGGGNQIDGKNAYHFDLAQNIDSDTLAKLNLTTFAGLDKAPIENSIFSNPLYASLLTALQLKLSEDSFQTANATSASDESVQTNGKNLLRICIQSLGSPLWYSENFSANICLFLTLLKALVRHSLAICCLTVPTHLFQHFDDTLLYRIRNIVDYAIELESFAGSSKETNPVFKEYHGLLYIRKMVALNSLASFTPETHDLAFKLRRKRFIIEKLHLPPELQESDQREQDDLVPSMSCGSASKKLLEF